jgi:hypothetical protein
LLRSPHQSHHLWAMMADEASSKFRPKMASLQTLLILESERAFSWSTAITLWWMAFSRDPGVAEKGGYPSVPFRPFRRS